MDAKITHNRIAEIRAEIKKLHDELWEIQSKASKGKIEIDGETYDIMTEYGRGAMVVRKSP